MPNIILDKSEYTTNDTINVKVDGQFAPPSMGVGVMIDGQRVQLLTGSGESKMAVTSVFFLGNNYGVDILLESLELDEGIHNLVICNSNTNASILSTTFNIIGNEITWTIGNKKVESLTINNKEVKSILRTSDNTIIYEQAQGEEEVVVKIDTKFVSEKEFYLYDVNNNPLSGKTVHITAKYGDYDVVTDSTGSCGIVRPLSAVFDGDSQYNGCTW